MTIVELRRELAERIAMAKCKKHGTELEMFREPTEEQNKARNDFFAAHVRCSITILPVVRS